MPDPTNVGKFPEFSAVGREAAEAPSIAKSALDPVQNIKQEVIAMSKPVTLNVRIRGALGDFVMAHVGAEGSYENVSEYVRDLIRRDKERLKPSSLVASRQSLRRDRKSVVRGKRVSVRVDLGGRRII